MGDNDDQRMDDDRRAAERSEDAALVARARGEDPDAFGRIYDRWFTRVHDLAFRIVRDDAAASDVAQDAFISAWKGLDKLETPEAFGGWLLRITRNGALDRKRRDARATPFDDEGLAMIEAAGPSPASAPAGFRVEDRTRSADDPANAVEDGELVALVWESAAALGDRDAEILDLGLRHGLTPAEIGEAVGLNRNAANQAVHRARNRLKTAVEARVLWRSGEPVCEGLGGALTTANVGHFADDHDQAGIVVHDRGAGFERSGPRAAERDCPVARTGAQASIVTGVPSGICWAIGRTLSLSMRMQPFDTSWPSIASEAPPWIAIWPGPPLKVLSTSE